MRKLREGHKVSIRLFTMAIMSSLLLVLGALPTIVSQRSPLLYSKQRGAIAAIIQNGTVHTGNVFFVMTGGSDTTGQGQHPHAPFATVDFAIGQCTANQGDVIYVMPGYTETITNSSRWTVDVAGISIIGLGHGTTKPTITLATDTSADILVSAANVVIKNFPFVTTIDSLVNFWDLNAANFLGEDCDFVGDSSAQALGFINIATTIDDFVFRRCKFQQDTDPDGTDGAVDTGVFFIIDSENIKIEDCEFNGNFETAIFHNRTTACKNLFVKNCHGMNLLSGSETFQLVAGATGAQLGGGFLTPAEAAVTEATLVGTVGNGFFVLPPGTYGNDGGAGGQGGIVIATPS